MPDDQLNGWKEIATYLGKSTRAAQRWERDLSMPVRRMRTAKGGEIVYAVKSEIEQWKLTAGKERDASDKTTNDDAPVSLKSVSHVYRNTLAFGAVVMCLVALIAFGMQFGTRFRPSAATSELDLVTASDAPSGSDPGPWPTHGHDSRRTNRSAAFAGPAHPTSAALIFDTHSPTQHAALSALSNGNVLLGTCGAVFAVDVDGRLQWKQTLTRRGFAEDPGGFAADAKGRIYFGTAECPDGLDAIRLGTYALLPTGEVYWQRQHASVHLAPTIGADGRIYVTDETNTIHAFAPDGTLLWVTDLPGYSQGMLAVTGDGGLIVGTDGALFNMTSLWRLDHDGRVRWTKGDGSLSTPLVMGDTVTVVGEQGGRVSAIDSAGRVLWTTGVDGKLGEMPFALGMRAIYVRSTSWLTALDSTGRKRWEIPAAVNAKHAEAGIVDRNNDIFFFDETAVSSVTSGGQPRWRVPLVGVDRIVLGAEGVILAFGQGRLYVIRG